MLKERWVVYASFLIIFAFTTVDASISPMVLPLHRHFGVSMDEILLLISSCTAGIVLGVFWGPMLTRSVMLSRLVVVTVAAMVLGVAGFLAFPSFAMAVVFRFVFGLGGGIMASLMWWLTFHGVSKANYQAMVNVLMSARPLAAALGVPFATIVAAKSAWHSPFLLFAVLILGCGALLYAQTGKVTQTIEKWEAKSLLRDYGMALGQPQAMPFYLGMVFSKACYFGIYAIAGIWFYRHYGLQLLEVGSRLFFIGMAEVAMTFAAPYVLRYFGYVKTLVGSIVLSAAVFLVLVKAYCPLWGATLLFVVFVGLDRVISMALTLSLPKMFPDVDNRAIFGSLVTLSAWMGLALVSYLEGDNLARVGLGAVEWGLLASFVFGSCLICYVQRVRVFSLMD
ncbi:putative MFS family arabinose efflux permease [Paludibacterium purpuratum]|uniref:Putative MFS family arabinose efflux permease n=2 Tax=Paludibacterium purpuratum TaxID=1144873 RepID=A0A4R7AZA4_9NEIS|nr:putative MFS family arabinose efflux permease [Paludibacterium purpuratum]